MPYGIYTWLWQIYMLLCIYIYAYKKVMPYNHGKKAMLYLACMFIALRVIAGAGIYAQYIYVVQACERRCHCQAMPHAMLFFLYFIYTAC